MQRIRWVGFGTCGSAREATLHLVARSRRVSAPYPVKAQVTVFFEGRILGSSALDGIRLHQPSVLCLSDTFTGLRSLGIGEFGFELNLSPPQPSIDLEDSQLSVQLQTAAGHSAYSPVKYMTESGKPQPGPESEELSRSGEDIAMFRCGDSCASLFFVNPSSENLSVSIEAEQKKKEISLGHYSVRRVEYRDLDSFPEVTRKVRGAQVSSRLVSLSSASDSFSCFTAFHSEKGTIPLQVERV